MRASYQKILMVIPSLDRKQGLSECLQCLISNSTGLADYFAVTRRTGGWIKALNSISMELLSQYEVVGIMNDDVRMRTPGWDRIVLDRMDGKIGLVYGRDGIQDERLCTQPFISAEAIVRAGCLAPSCMEHSLVDNLWMEVFRSLGALHYEPALFTEHLHYTVNKSPMDSTYALGADAWSRDWPKWDAFAAREVPRLVSRIRNPTSKTVGKRVISFALWGNDPLHSSGLSANAEFSKRWFPGWSLRLYCEPQHVAKASGLGYEVFERKITKGPWEGLFWRFEPVYDPEVDVFISRDLDSRLNPRESAAVAEWLSSGKFAHVMRDHPAHDVAMLGGMWGCRHSAEFAELFQAKLKRWGAWDHKGCDQEFLSQHIWPSVDHRALIHDSVHQAAGIQVFPTHEPMDSRIYGGFVGAIVRP